MKKAEKAKQLVYGMIILIGIITCLIISLSIKRKSSGILLIATLVTSSIAVKSESIAKKIMAVVILLIFIAYLFTK